MTRTERLLKIQAEVEAAARKLHAERCRAWRAKNPRKSADASRKWAKRNPIAHKLSKRMWKFFNRDKHNAITRAWRKANPNYQREYRARMWVPKPRAL